MCWLASLLRPRPYVLFCHGMDVALALRNPWKRWLTKRIMRQAHAVVANTHALARELRERVGIEPLTVHPMASIIDTREGVAVLERDETVVELLSVARLVPRKGMQRVLAVLARHPEWSRSVRYRMVGTGSYATELREMIHAYGLSAWVTLEETSDDALLRAAYEKADVFVLPTITAPHDREGFGIVYMEAGSFGLPCIASRVPGVDEAVLDGETGVLVANDEELEEALTRAIHDAPWRERCGRAGRERVQATTEDTVYAPLDIVLHHREVPRARVTVIIPLYNHARTLPGVVESVLCQEGVDINLIIVNDGSTDEGGEVADALAEQHAAVHVLHQVNAGAPAARNAGLARATGDFVICLDADVELRDGILARWVHMLAMHPRAGYVYGDFRFGKKRFHTGPFSFTRLRQRPFIHTSALVRREAGLRFDPSLKRFQDWDAWLTLAERGVEGVWDGGGTAMDVAVDRPGYSSWLPKAAYTIPFCWLPWWRGRVNAYRRAEGIIRAKHHLP
jgi:hypothetical protein